MSTHDTQHRIENSSLASRLALALLASLLCLVILELAVRVTMAPAERPSGGLDPTGLTVPDPDLGHRLSPNFDGPWVRGVRITTNASGFRDIDHGPKQANEIRLLSLGDSNAFGWGVAVSDSYPQLIQHHFQEKLPACKISVINAAVHGYSTFQQLKLLKALAPQYSPDFVLWTFSSSNDVIENAVLAAHSAQPESEGVLGQSQLLRLAKRALAPALYFIGNRTEENLEETRRLISSLLQELTQRSLPHEAIIIPARHQVRPQIHIATKYLHMLGLDFLITKQSDAIIDYFRQADVSFTDALPIFQYNDLVSPVMFRDDNHPNENGHRIIANAVSQKIWPRIAQISESRCQIATGSTQN